mgnify:CR=1 FL=1
MRDRDELWCDVWYCAGYRGAWAEGRLILTLEGGYDLNALAKNARICGEVLGGALPPKITEGPSTMGIHATLKRQSRRRALFRGSLSGSRRRIWRTHSSFLAENPWPKHMLGRAVNQWLWDFEAAVSVEDLWPLYHRNIAMRTAQWSQCP